MINKQWQLKKSNFHTLKGRTTITFSAIFCRKLRKRQKSYYFTFSLIFVLWIREVIEATSGLSSKTKTSHTCFCLQCQYDNVETDCKEFTEKSNYQRRIKADASLIIYSVIQFKFVFVEWTLMENMFYRKTSPSYDGFYFQIKEERLRSMFGSVGTLTDCSLKYTKEGVFRNFAFIGYTSETEADQAINQYNKTFINACRIYVRLKAWTVSFSFKHMTIAICAGVKQLSKQCALYKIINMTWLNYSTCTIKFGNVFRLKRPKILVTQASLELGASIPGTVQHFRKNRKV